jgi:predicted dehydrogenase
VPDPINHATGATGLSGPSGATDASGASGATDATAPPLRFGVLGAARIAPAALIRPARDVPGVSVAAVAARDPARAEKFASKHGVPVVHRSYEDLLADDRVDAVYVPLPNGLHAEWTLKAIAAGKHVLCEKPMTSNAAEAAEVAAAADASGLVVAEAFHYRYHALAERMRVIAHGELGAITSVRVWTCFPLPAFRDIRYDYSLGGGATMDAGCYALHCLRLLGPTDPVVGSARAATHGEQVDRAMSAWLRFPGSPANATGRIDCSLWSRRVLRIAAHVTGERGEMRVWNFVAPQYLHRVRLRVDGRTTRFRVPGEPTYTAQLRAFAASVRTGEPPLTPAADAVPTMRLIDDIYRAAELSPRGQDQSGS